jgi:hypothetical protein
MKNHIWMLLACLLPLLLIFVLPAMGIQSSPIFSLLLVGCFVMHLFMMKGHGHGDNGKGDHHDEHD